MNHDIRELDICEIDTVSGGGIGNTIVNVAREIADTVNPPTKPITLPTIPQIGQAIVGLGSAIASIF
ncbi:MAG TPA: hypothetical protein VHC94_14875 [Nitrobacter sp.]|jgi:hypothetical protein|nr:hypothetical protein [Nitrobacter sp.]